MKLNVRLKKLWIGLTGAVAVCALSAGVVFAANYYVAGDNPTFTQQSKGIYVYNDGTEDRIVLDARDITNLKIYSDEWDGVVAAQMAPVFDDTHDYAVGDIVTYDNRLFKCTNATTHDGTFPAGSFTSVKITELLAEAGLDLNTFKQTLDEYHEAVIGTTANAYDDQRTYHKGEACTNDGKIYVCKVADSTPGAFRSEEFDEKTLVSFISDMNSAVATQQEQIENMEGMIGDAWTMGSDYYVGNYTIDNDTLYICTSDVAGSSTKPSEDAAHFKAVNVADVLEYADDFKMSVSGGTGDIPYKLTVTKVN